MEVAVREGAGLELARPHRLFPAPFFGSGSAGPVRGFDVHPDGRRFLFTRRKQEPPPRPPITRLTIVHNWFAELERLARAK